MKLKGHNEPYDNYPQEQPLNIFNFSRPQMECHDSTVAKDVLNQFSYILQDIDREKNEIEQWD